VRGSAIDRLYLICPDFGQMRSDMASDGQPRSDAARFPGHSNAKPHALPEFVLLLDERLRIGAAGGWWWARWGRGSAIDAFT
jgi:hypothetical protein